MTSKLATASFRTIVSSGLDVGFGGNGKTSSIAESLRRNFDSGRRLLALVFVALHHANHALDQVKIEVVFASNLLGRVRLLNIVLKNSIQHFVIWQSVAVLLIQTQFGRWRLVESGLRYHGLARIHVTAEAINQRFRNIINYGESSGHVAIKRAVADTQF